MKVKSTDIIEEQEIVNLIKEYFKTKRADRKITNVSAILEEVCTGYGMQESYSTKFKGFQVKYEDEI